MKFQVAWAKLASENHILKTSLLGLSAFSVFLAISTIRLALKDPLVIERACISKAVYPSNGKRTESEISEFLKVALSQRFDSDARPQSEFVDSDELALREKEQKDLKSRKLSQKVIISSVKFDKGGAFVDADRLIAIGEVRSAFRFPLNARVESVSRTESNPYGLVLESVNLIKKGDNE